MDFKKRIFFIPLVLFLVGQLLFAGWIPDDAFISFRYAENLAGGTGLVFNPGEKVEGFSNFLWTLYLAAASRCGLDTVKAAVITSIAAGIMAVLLIFALLCLTANLFFVPESRNRASLCFGFALAASIFFPLLFYTSSGMESTVYLLFLLLGAYLHILGSAHKDRRLLNTSLFTFLIAALLRPEGVLFLVLASFFYLLLLRPASPRKLITASVPLLIYCLVIAIKAAYFGGLLPNTYFAKPGASLHNTQPLSRGSFYLLRFFTKSALLLFLPFALYPPAERRKTYIWTFLWSMVLTQILFIVYAGADVLRFDRFTLPFYPFYLALSLGGIGEMLNSKKPAYRKLLRRCALFCISLIVAFNIWQVALAKSKVCTHDWMQGGSLKALGLLLGDALPEGSTVASNEVGALAYYSKLRIIDMLGLTNDTISRIRYNSILKEGVGSSPQSISEVSDYILSRTPECIILPSYDNITDQSEKTISGIMHPQWFRIFVQRDFQDHYHRVLSVKINTSKYINIFVLNGVAFEPPSSLSKSFTRCWKVVWKAPGLN